LQRAASAAFSQVSLPGCFRGEIMPALLCHKTAITSGSRVLRPQISADGSVRRRAAAAGVLCRCGATPCWPHL
jgi:hypothetical protein